MLNILIVDDEEIERNVIRYLLNQRDYGFQVFEAVNGEVALSILQQCRIDILITDIQMPVMDGILLSERAKSIQPNISIIFFSCYDDFTYIKKAMSLKATNYIMKPVESEEFHGTIADVLASRINRETQDAAYSQRERIIQNYMLCKILEGKKIAYLQGIYPNIDFSFLDTCCRLALIRIDGVLKATVELTPDKLKEILPPGSIFLSLNKSFSAVILMKCERPENWFESFSKELQSYIQQLTHLPCAVIVSSEISSPEKITDVYEETVHKLAECSIAKFGSSETSPSIASTDDILDILRRDVQIEDWTNLHRHMQLLFSSFKTMQPFSYSYCRFMCTSALKILLSGLPVEECANFDEYISEISNSFSLSSAEELLMRITKKLEFSSGSVDSSSHLHTLRIVKQYIRDHYAEELNLDKLAQEVFISKSYLSKLFADYHGFGISKYIKMIRLEKAKELLLTTALPVYEISKRVGYTSDSYFCKSFAKEYGVAPDKFRNDRHFSVNSKG